MTSPSESIGQMAFQLPLERVASAKTIHSFISFMETKTKWRKRLRRCKYNTLGRAC